MKTITLRLEDEQHKKLKHQAVDLDVTMQDLIIDLLDFADLISTELEQNSAFRADFLKLLAAKAKEVIPIQSDK